MSLAVQYDLPRALADTFLQADTRAPLASYRGLSCTSGESNPWAPSIHHILRHYALRGAPALVPVAQQKSSASQRDNVARLGHPRARRHVKYAADDQPVAPPKREGERHNSVRTQRSTRGPATWSATPSRTSGPGTQHPHQAHVHGVTHGRSLI